MKALSLWQPWASFIAAGVKEYETRHWTTRYRGLVAIHAANHGARGFLESEWRHIERLKFEHPEIRTVMATPLPFGAILCVCELEAIYKTEVVAPYLSALEKSVGDYSDGRAAWKFKMVRVFDEPIPVRGAQGLWEWAE